MTETSRRGRGRPRPNETINRDEQVRQLLVRGPLSRAEIAEKLDVNLNLAYLALDRLRQQEVVRQVRSIDGDGRTYLWELAS